LTIDRLALEKGNDIEVKEVRSYIRLRRAAYHISFNVQAFPILSPPEVVAGPDLELVRDFCGRRFHRDPSGHCVRNGTPYSPPAYAPPPDPVAPIACRYGYHLFPYARCFVPACTYGYYLGPYGQCFPYWRAIM
jgi:hypothetical protein